VSLSPSIQEKYEILAKLSEGGMGAVYKVRHRLLDEIRVIKVALPQAGPTAERRERFLSEARSASRLVHPHIARILDFLIDERDQQVLVFEHIDGLNLKEVIALTGPPPLGLTVEIARQALEALGWLHRCGFVHRDIAPDNLMLTRDGHGAPLVKLIDLGIAKAVTADAGPNPALTQTGIFLGKPFYAAPEQFTGAPVDARTDLYSFGIVLYELLTGRLPLQGGSVHEMLAAHLQGEPLSFTESDPEGRVPAGLRQIILRLLAKRPEDRFADAGQVAAALAPFTTPWLSAALDEILAARPADAPTPEPAVLPPPDEPVAGTTRQTAQPAPPPLTVLRRGVGRAPILSPAVVGALGIAALILLGLWVLHLASAKKAARENETPAQASTLNPSPPPPTEPAGDLPAQPLDPPAPIYPAEALAFGLPVRVTVDLTVDEKGAVKKAAAPFMDAEQPIPSNLYKLFRNAAQKAARDLRFQPATRNGKPVRSTVRLIVEVKP
jgi:serine/threonine-protein kinase